MFTISYRISDSRICLLVVFTSFKRSAVAFAQSQMKFLFLDFCSNALSILCMYCGFHIKCTKLFLVFTIVSIPTLDTSFSHHALRMRICYSAAESQRRQFSWTNIIDANMLAYQKERSPLLSLTLSLLCICPVANHRRDCGMFLYEIDIVCSTVYWNSIRSLQAHF